MNRRAWLVVIALGLAGSVLLGEQAVVKTRDGQSLQGEYREAGDNVILTIRGVETTIPKSDIASVERTGDYETQFMARLNQLARNDTASRIALAREAFNQARYELARRAVENALANDPNSREANDMLELIQSQIRLERTKQEPQAPSIPTTRPAPPAPVVDRRLLTPADVEAIRKAELRPDDLNTRIRFDGDVKKRFADFKNITFTEFNANPVPVQALAILSETDETMRTQVRVLSDPSSMLDYRRQIQPLVIQNCATTGCHGTAGAGGFMLFSPAENETVAYTNFYILQSYARRGESGGRTFGNAVIRLIDRAHGANSLLANFGLPTNIAEYDHPPVNGRPIQPIFRNREDLRYRMVVDWMDRSLLPVVKDYGIRYTPPQPLPNPAAGQLPGIMPTPLPTPGPAPAQ